MKSWLFNLAIDPISRSEALETCYQFLSVSSCHTLCFLNAHCFNVAQSHPGYAAAIGNADLVLNDGVGIKLVSVVAGVDLQENLNGTDFIPQLLQLAASIDAPVYLLGGKPGIAEEAAMAIQVQNTGIRIAGCRSGYFGPGEEQAVLDDINRSQAQLVVLGMGVPRQELWAERHREQLEGVRLIVSGGAILDFLSGATPRAPAWLQRLRLEWLFRLGLEPRRMWRRYILGSCVLLRHVLRLTRTSRPTQER